MTINLTLDCASLLLYALGSFLSAMVFGFIGMTGDFLSSRMIVCTMFAYGSFILSGLLVIAAIIVAVIQACCS